MKDSMPTFPSSLFPFSANRISAHAMPTTCVLCGIDGPIALKTATERIEGAILLVRPQVHHQVKAVGCARLLNFDGLAFPFSDTLARSLEGHLQGITIDALWGSEKRRLELREQLAHKQPLCPPDISAIVSHLAQDPMSRMTQIELAEKLGMERTQSLRYFKQFTGMTFRSYKRWLGIQNAAYQLISGDLVRNAALDNGFSDTAHLSRSFRTVLGITPTDGIAGYRCAVNEKPHPGLFVN
ncbi:AraC family transcriptional regulator [Microbulbifer spongiae]|uniref:AraC family transcriptional regulator n=1 Tax=Microbulbifer spongiae TaxID=2944933 RepID=A0ABY9E9H1_9GAMM|nr:AraC family transcriptional regulator [Microbulbifer sp. MI-G]WKD49663.1 AraC family transcriptional regulator [Microbulbifer sp. MI-G]